MKDIVFCKLESFLKKHIKSKRPVLLGYSGGPDSKALFYLLLEYQKKSFLDLHVAHVDHRWRKESKDQAIALKKEVEGKNIPFHLDTLDGIEGNNLEDKCRKMRLLFFKKLFKKYNFQALFLGHQKDDVAETVLKRFLEGADFSYIKGIQEKKVIDDMVVLRPLLAIEKKDLKSWIKNKNLSFIDDETNRDKKYLRGNLRENIIPYLSSEFGKEISNNLYVFSLRSQELKKYLDKKTDKYFYNKKEGPFGIYLEKDDIFNLESLEIKHLIKRIIKYLDLDISRKNIERIFFSLKKDFKIVFKDYTLISEKNFIFFIKNTQFKMEFLKTEFFKKKPFEIKKGNFCFKDWKIEVKIKYFDEFNEIKNPSWKDVFFGCFTFFLPEDRYYLDFPKNGDRILEKRLNKWFSETKVPKFMRFSFPVIFKEKNVYYEFLSGKKRFKSLKGNFYKILIKLK